MSPFNLDLVLQFTVDGNPNEPLRNTVRYLNVRLDMRLTWGSITKLFPQNNRSQFFAFYRATKLTNENNSTKNLTKTIINQFRTVHRCRG